MTTYNDAKLDSLRIALNRTDGHIDDLYHQWLRLQTIGLVVGDTTSDMEQAWLQRFMAPIDGTTQDLWIAYLHELGLTGHLNDMLLIFWQGLIFLPILMENDTGPLLMEDDSGAIFKG